MGAELTEGHRRRKAFVPLAELKDTLPTRQDLNETGLISSWTGYGNVTSLAYMMHQVGEAFSQGQVPDAHVGVICTDFINVTAILRQHGPIAMAVAVQAFGDVLHDALADIHNEQSGSIRRTIESDVSIKGFSRDRNRTTVAYTGGDEFTAVVIFDNGYPLHIGERLEEAVSVRYRHMLPKTQLTDRVRNLAPTADASNETDKIVASDVAVRWGFASAPLFHVAQQMLPGKPDRYSPQVGPSDVLKATMLGLHCLTVDADQRCRLDPDHRTSAVFADATLTGGQFALTGQLERAISRSDEKRLSTREFDGLRLGHRPNDG